MLVTDEALQAVDHHWSVLAVGAGNRERALAIAKARLAWIPIGGFGLNNSALFGGRQLCVFCFQLLCLCSFSARLIY